MTFGTRSFPVFISYAHADSERARDAYRRLRAARLDPWLDVESLPAGAEWQFDIEAAIRRSQVVLVLLSKNSVAHDGFLQREIRYALEIWQEKAPGRTYLVPVRLEHCEPHQRLAHLNWIDVWEESGWIRLLQELRQLRDAREGLMAGAVARPSGAT